MTDESAPPANGETAAPVVTADPVVEQVTSDAPPIVGDVATPDSEARRLKKAQETRERIEELNAKAKAGIEYGDFWRSKFEESQRVQAPAVAAPAAPVVDPEPQVEQFDDVTAFTRAYSAWARKEAVRDARQVAEQAVKESQSAAEKAIFKAREEERLKTLDGGFTTRSQSFAEANPDYYTAIGNPALTFFNGDFLEAVKGNEKGPEIAYHIAKSPKLVAQLASQSVPQRLATLGRIEAELSRPAPSPKVTAAPNPPTPVAGASVSVDAEPKDISDWMSWRNKQDPKLQRLRR